MISWNNHALLPKAYVSADIMEIPEMEILKTWRVMTVINGEIVWGAPR